MQILDGSGQNWGFPFADIKVIDNTYVTAVAPTNISNVPDFNMLIPVRSPIGLTNVLELYQPGSTADYIANHGAPNAIRDNRGTAKEPKYDFNPYAICGVLDRSTSGVGVYTINLRDKTATMANLALVMKYKVVAEEGTEDLPDRDVLHVKFLQKSVSPIVTDEWLEEQAAAGVDTGALAAGDPILYYLNENNAETLVTDLDNIPTGAYTKGIHKWTEMQAAMQALYSDTADDEGYKTIPWWGVMYRGASSFANNMYFNMKPSIAPYDRSVYYTISLFNGNKMVTTDPIYSLDPESGKIYGTSYYIENLFNTAFPSMRFVSATPSDDIKALFSQYLFTAEEIAAGATEPALKFANIDVFTATDNQSRPLFQVVVDNGSLDVTKTQAFQFQGGFDGIATADELYESFFKGEILEDIIDPLRYRLNYIPDLGYNEATKDAIQELVHDRNRMTVATFMLGNDSFSSAVGEHQTKWFDTEPCIRQIAAVQGAMRYDSYTSRMMRFPAGYYDTLGLVDFFISRGNFYEPYAGADARWHDFEEDTMAYPSHRSADLQQYFDNRINVVMKDWMDGCYMSDQLMNTQLQSDQTEFNNALIVSNMLYDLVRMIHRNHFKFNEPEHVRAFGEAVAQMVANNYARYAVSMVADVQRVGTIGRAKMTNKITVTINFLDINRYTNVELVLTDE